MPGRRNDDALRSHATHLRLASELDDGPQRFSGWPEWSTAPVISRVYLAHFERRIINGSTKPRPSQADSSTFSIAVTLSALLTMRHIRDLSEISDAGLKEITERWRL